jgi:integrase
MATRMYLDTRSAKSDGTYPLKYSISYRGMRVMVGSGISILSNQWDEHSGKIVKHAQRMMLNQIISSRIIEIDTALLSLKQTPHDTSTLRSIIENVIVGDNGADDKTLFCEFMEQFMAMGKTSSTQGLYSYTLTRIKSFDKNWMTLTFDDIDYKWLTAFVQSLSDLKVNTRRIHLGNIRATFNEAIRQDLTTVYPFRKFRFTSEKTPKRSLLPEQLAQLRDFPCIDHQTRYRDLFMLIFYLIGINSKDLFFLTEGNVRNGRIEYRRAKTGRLYSILLEPEAESIIKKYHGANHLLFVMDEYKEYKDFLHRMNDNLRKIGPIEYTLSKVKGKSRQLITYHGLFPDLTTYWARHTWATVAHKIGVPKDVISMALGHSFGNRVTDTYIDYDSEKVDEANRKVIDYLNGIYVKQV